MKIGIMQPYFFPYIGYWQLIHAVDRFVVYDDIQYSKGGWINRNRIGLENEIHYITLPLKKDSDYLDVRERYLADIFPKERKTILGKITAAYRRAPEYAKIFPIVESCVNYEDFNLFRFIFHSIEQVLTYLEIDTEIVVSSSVDVDPALKRENRVMALCKSLDGTNYVNPIGGIDLYRKEDFRKEGIDLMFLESKASAYKQGSGAFLPNLSIIDVLMYNPMETVREMLDQYILR